MKQTQIGEPILTADGQSVAAFWAVSMGLDADCLHFTPPIQRWKVKALTDDASPIYDPIDMLTVWHHVTMPDGRTYWRICEGAPAEWWKDCHWFAPVPATPSSEPAGMVAAYDLVCNDLELRGCPAHEMQRLDYVHEYWKWAAKRA